MNVLGNVIFYNLIFGVWVGDVFFDVSWMYYVDNGVGILLNDVFDLYFVVFYEIGNLFGFLDEEIVCELVMFFFYIVFW